MSKFKYTARSSESLQSRVNQQGGDFDSVLLSSANTVKVKEGENTFRLLPPTWDKKKYGDGFGIEIWSHNDIGPDKQQYLCLNKMKDEPCPICDALEDLDEEIVKKIKARKRILSYIINRDDEKAGPLIWNYGWTLEQKIAIRAMDRKTGEAIPIDDPEEGYDISFTRKGTGLNTDYFGEALDRDPSPIHSKPAKQDAWLDFITENPLPDMLNFYPYDYIEKVFMGKKSKKEDDEDKPRNKRKASTEDDDEPAPKRSARRAEPAPEEDDEIPDDRQMAKNGKRARAESADDEDASPARKSTRRAEPADDAEEETPQRRRRAAPEEPEDEPAPRSRRVAVEEDDDEPAPKRSARRAEPAPEEDDDGEEDDKAVTNRAKKSIERMKPSGRR